MWRRRLLKWRINDIEGVLKWYLKEENEANENNDETIVKPA